MSYCRFENTSRDMNDCLEALDNGDVEELSMTERDGLANLLSYAKYIIELEDEINEIISKTDED